MNEAQKYSNLQYAKQVLRQALEDIKKWDEALGGTNTYDGEVLPVIDEVFPDVI